MICANDVSVEGQGFNSNDNAITVYWKDGKQSLTLASKQQIASQIITTIAKKLEA
jgi:phosphopantothenoylcysteine decarboxylase/phosphopantothenate--cysteine ligase